MNANVYTGVTSPEARTSVSRRHAQLEFESATATKQMFIHITSLSNFKLSIF